MHSVLCSHKLHTDLIAKTKILTFSYLKRIYLYVTLCRATVKRASVCVQAGAGLVADSVPESEYEETVNKAAALGRAIDLAEQAFVDF